MKKVFLSLLVLAATINATAAITYSASAKLTITSGDSYTTDLIVAESSNYTTAMEIEPDNIIAIYAMNGTTRCSKLCVASLGNRAIGFKATQSLTYTITCTAATGNALYVKVGDEDPVQLTTTMEAIVINIEAAQKGTYVDNAFALYVAEQPYTRDNLTIGDWGTICLPKASSKIEGATMYEVKGYDEEKGVALLEFGATQQMVAGTPYVFKATETELKVTLTGEAVTDTVVVEGGFIGSFAGMDVEDGNYIIYNNALYKTISCSIAANRAFFDLENMNEYNGGNAPGRKLVFMGGKGISTGVEAAEVAPAMNGKVMINGQMVIIRDGKMFNAQGAEL